MGYLLDIDESEFAKAVGKMSRRKAKEFLALIAEEAVLEDDESILKQLLYQAIIAQAMSASITNNLI